MSDLVDHLRREFSGEANVTIVSTTVESYISAAPDGSSDNAVLVNVLEHIEDDAEVVSELFRLLRPGGHIMIFVPAMSWLFSPLDAAVGHHRRYEKGAMADLVGKAGFEIIDVRYFDLFGIVPWWLIYTLGGKMDFSPRLSRLYDRLIVPVTRALEALIPPPVGKNLVLVARKPGTWSEAEKDARP